MRDIKKVSYNLSISVKILEFTGLKSPCQCKKILCAFEPILHRMYKLLVPCNPVHPAAGSSRRRLIRHPHLSLEIGVEGDWTPWWNKNKILL